MRTAVWMVMERAHDFDTDNGFSKPYFSRVAIRPGSLRRFQFPCDQFHRDVSDFVV